MASLLESFVYLFEADTSNLEEGLDDAEKKTEDLGKATKKTDEQSKELGKSFLDTVSSAKGALVALVGLGGLSAALIGNAKSVDELGKFSQRLGLNVSEVDAWGQAVVRTGGSVQGFQSTLAGLSTNLAEFARTGTGGLADLFGQLGIAAFDEQGNVKDALDILPDIADRLDGLSAVQSAEIAEKLGLDQGTILLLQQGRGEVEKIIRAQRELGTVNEKDAKAAADFNDQMADVKKIFSNVVTTIATSVLPYFKFFLDGLKSIIDFAKENKELVTGFFIGIGVVVAALLLPFAGLIATAALVTAGVLAIGAAFALIYEDIQAFRNGQDSLIGEMIEKYPVLNDIIKGFGDAWDYVKAKASEVWEILKSIPDDVEGGFKRLTIAIIGIFKDIGKAVSDIWTEVFSSENIDAGLETLKEKFTAIVDVLKKVFSGIFSGIVEAIPGIGSLFGGTDSGIADNMIAGQGALATAAASPLGAQTSSSLTSTRTRNTSVSIGAMNVDARGGDSKDIAARSKDALSGQLRSAVTEFDDGVEI